MKSDIFAMAVVPHGLCQACLACASLPAGLPALFGLVALAAGKHPFPSRTRPLRLHAVMILRPGAWESNAPPILCLAGLHCARAQGRPAFFVRAVNVPACEAGTQVGLGRAGCACARLGGAL